jgi:hypothetical protein
MQCSFEIATLFTSSLKLTTMRKLIFAAIGTLFISAFTFAQDYAYHNPFPKATIMSFMAGENSPELNATTVSIDANTKLQKSFNKHFKNASNVNWYMVKKDYLAVFDYNGRKTRALFGKNGYNVYSIAYGAEKDLPKDYRKSIKSMYVDADILNAIEVHSGAVRHTTWLTTVKDEEKIVIARIIDGGVDEFARFETSPKQKKQRKGRIIIPKG